MNWSFFGSVCERRPALLVVVLLLAGGCLHHLRAADAASNSPAAYPKIEAIDPPENGFFTKVLSFHGILIKAPAVVGDAAMFRAYDRMALETAGIPMVVSNIAAAGGELHIIGRHQVTTDLPEWRLDKHVPLYEPTYNGQTRDARTRGMGGLITSCGEENLLNLPEDRYRGSDICLHEFAHNIEGTGMSREIRARFDAQYQVSKEKGLWLHTYAGSNPSEYFAELTMWYFNSHGSYSGFQGARPGTGRAGLKEYDPDAFALFDEFYRGKMDLPQLPVRHRGWRSAHASEVGTNPTPAGRVVGRLNSYKVGETKLTELYADAGLTGPGQNDDNGWVITLRNAPQPDATQNPAPPAEGPASVQVRVSFHHATYGNASIADLDFKDGVLTGFRWNN